MSHIFFLFFAHVERGEVIFMADSTNNLKVPLLHTLIIQSSSLIGAPSLMQGMIVFKLRVINL